MAQGKVYTSAPILINSDGMPIPAFLDRNDKTDSPEGTYKPITDEHYKPVHDVQLTGSIVEKAHFYNSLALADTERKQATVDTYKYKQFQVIVRSTLDVDLDVIIVYNGVPRKWDGTNWSFDFRRFTVPANNIDTNLLNTLYEWLDRPLDYLRIDIQALDIPTSGIVDIYALGVVR